MRYKLLIFFALCFAFVLRAADDWYRFPVFTDSLSDIVETKNRVYYLSPGNLFSYSPDSEEGYAYSSLNRLTGNSVSRIFYNDKGGYLLIAYDDCNIDLLYDDGRVVNLPDIRDAAISSTKVINDVAFGAGRIVVGTSFGIVVFDDKKHEVIEGGIYNVNIELVAIMNDHLLIYYRLADGFGVCASPLKERHNTLDKFKQVGWGVYTKELTPLSDKRLLMQGKESGKIMIRDIDFNKFTWKNSLTFDIVPTQDTRPYDGGFFTFTPTQLVVIDPEKEAPQTIELPSALHGQKIALRDDIDKLWVGNNEGIARYDISGGTPTVLNDRFVHADAITCTKIAYMRWSPDGRRLYVSNQETSEYKSWAKAECSDAYQTTNIIESGYPRDASLKDATVTHVKSLQWQKLHGNKRMYGDPAWIIEDPDNTDIYYCANNHEGLYIIQYNPETGQYEEKAKIDVTNSPIEDNWGARVEDVNLDQQGNLWVGYQKGSNYMILPADKRRQGPENIKASDWIEYTKIGSYNLDKKDIMSVLCKKSNMAFIFACAYMEGFLAIDTKGTWTDPSDDTVMHWRSVTDQDGNSIQAPERVTFAIEDRRGCVWIGTTSGVFEITNPATAATPQMVVRRIKVPRNDGTNYADYLLDSDQINWIALDPSGRKWIATESSGLFLVSETGDKIIRNYNTSNSPLPSNSICSVETDNENNTVYVGTPYGLYTVLSDSAPAQEDFGSLYAYPNPVRPEYTGDVTIAGLMDNAVIKVADSSGNVVYQTRGEGGMATWPALDASGQRVRSGVYYVHAITESQSAVTKVLVIR